MNLVKSRFVDARPYYVSNEQPGTEEPAASPPAHYADSPSGSSQQQRDADADTSRPVDFLLVTALEDERDALLAALPSPSKLPKDDDDVHTYYSATLQTARRDGGSYRVVVTCLVQMGPIHAAAQTASAVAKWRPQAVMMVGIAGGVADQVALGDVLVADQVVDYTLGKVERDKDGKPRRLIRWETHRSDRSLFDSAKNLGKAWHAKVEMARPSGTGAPDRHLGVVASGGDVIADPDFIERYRDDWGKMIGVEMEGGGVATALHASFERPRFLMVRSVSDFADEEKNKSTTKEWRGYAYHVAAAYAVALLESGPLVPRRDLPKSTIPSSGQSLRGRDVRTLKEVLETIDGTSIDHFLARSQNYILPDHVFYYMEGFKAVYAGSAFYVHDEPLRSLVDAFAVSFLTCFTFGEYFEPTSDGNNYRFTNHRGGDHARHQDALARFERATTDTGRAFRALIRHVKEHWVEVDVEQCFAKARDERRRFYERADLDEAGAAGAPSEDQIRAAMDGLLRSAHAAAGMFLEGSTEREISLKLDTELERTAAVRLADEGRAITDGESVTIIVQAPI